MLRPGRGRIVVLLGVAAAAVLVSCRDSETPTAPEPPARSEVTEPLVTDREVEVAPESTGSPEPAEAPAPAPPTPPAPAPPGPVEPPTPPAPPPKPEPTPETPQATLPAPGTPPASEPAPESEAPSEPEAPAAADFEFDTLEKRLRNTKALGFFTKLELKSQIDGLLDAVRDYHERGIGELSELRERFDLLVLKVIALLQDRAADLAAEINEARTALWAILADPVRFAELEAK